MKYWTYVEPGKEGKEEYRTLSEKQILADYFPYWKKRMIEVGREHLITRQNCIDDWVTLHWAWKGKQHDTMAQKTNSRESEPRND
jgi:hypothetical protein